MCVFDFTCNFYFIAGAISCFVGYYAYMAIVAYNAPRDPKISPASAISKRIFVVLGIVLLIAAGLFSNTAYARARISSLMAFVL